MSITDSVTAALTRNINEFSLDTLEDLREKSYDRYLRAYESGKIEPDYLIEARAYNTAFFLVRDLGEQVGPAERATVRGESYLLPKAVAAELRRLRGVEKASSAACATLERLCGVIEAGLKTRGSAEP